MKVHNCTILIPEAGHCQEEKEASTPFSSSVKSARRQKDEFGLTGRAADPDAGRCGFAEVDGLAVDAQRESFIVAALKDFHLV
jgi:hypothetical protein